MIVARQTRRVVLAAGWLAAMVLVPGAPAAAQVVAKVAAGITPAWTTGIQAINSANYWNAVACGKKGGANPPCVYWDTDMCKNGEFALVMYTPYKQVAYTVWLAVSKKQPAPTPSYSEAQRQRIVLGITPLRGAQNPIASVAVKRGGKTIPPATQQLASGGGSFFFDYAAFAATGSLSIEMVGKTNTVSCAVSQATLGRMR